MLDLGFIAGSLLIAVSTDTAVRCDSELWLLSSLYIVSYLSFGRNYHYILDSGVG